MLNPVPTGKWEDLGSLPCRRKGVGLLHRKTRYCTILDLFVISVDKLRLLSTTADIFYPKLKSVVKLDFT